jgi:natural product biosynthesis luciferase-like monooxygenase protein
MSDRDAPPRSTGPMPSMWTPPRSASLVDLLDGRAEHAPEMRLITLLPYDRDGGVSTTAAGLWRRARAIASRLQRMGAAGETVLVPSPTRLDTMEAFWGATCAGAIPVPVPPLRRRHNERIERIARACRPACVIRAEADRALLDDGVLAAIPALDPGDVADEEAQSWRRPEWRASDTAFLQYTSGSTGNPNGVMVSHRNLMANAARMEAVFALDAQSRCVSWLPLYHDMGLIGGMMQAVYTGYPVSFMSPAAFIERPLRWLEAISRERATVSGGPNFGYELVARALAEPSDPFDLSSWTVAFNGSEPVRHRTLRRFARACRPFGFEPSALRPCYGLAEATLLVSCGRYDAAALDDSTDEEDGARVSLGPVGRGLTLEVVDPETRVVTRAGETGEIWLAGDSIADGYWDDVEATREVFGARSADGRGPWLRTGDLGVRVGDEIAVVDRLKDLIIIRGANYHAVDVEGAVDGCDPSLRPSACVAFGVAVDGDEQLVVVAETDRALSEGDADRVVSRVQQAIGEALQLTAFDVVLLRRGAIPRTSSGKVQRGACRAHYLQGAFGAASTRRREAAPHHALDLAIHGIVAEALGVREEDLVTDVEIGALGADSMRLMRARMAIEARAQISVSYSALVTMTVAELVARASAARPAVVRPSDAAEPEPTEAPLSVGQRGLWFLERVNPHDTANTIARVLRLRGPLDVEALEAAFATISRRHESLRLTVHTEGGDPVQRFTGCVGFAVRDAADGDEAAVAAEAAALAQLPFDLATGPLVTVELLRRSPVDHLLVFRAHHLAVDLWSLAIVLEEVEDVYRARRSPRERFVPVTAAARYSDFTSWQQALLSSAEGERLGALWYDRLKGHTEPLSFPAPPLPPGSGAGQTPFAMDGPTVERLRAVSRAQGTTLNALVITAFEILLSRYTGQRRFLIGTLSSGRTREAFASVVGYCVNLLPLRADVAPDATSEAVLRHTRDELNTALDHQDLPFSSMIERLHPHRDGHRAPLVRAVCVCQPADVLGRRDLRGLVLNRIGGAAPFADLTMEVLPAGEVGAQFDLSLVVSDGEDGLAGALHFDRAQFGAADVAGLVEGLQSILQGIARDSTRRVSDLPLVAAERFRERIASRSGARRPIGGAASVHEAIARQAEATPDAIALVAGSTQWTYAELQQRVEAAAARLREAGISREARVGVSVERSAEMVVALLAVMAAGGTYVPIDPAHPADRVARIVADASLAAIVVSRRTRDRVVGGASVLLSVHDLSEPMETPPRPVAVDPDSAAYVMYTSGSTGMPKGVIVSHRNVLNLFDGMDEKVGCSPADTLLAVTSISFDISVVELLWTLARGARVVIADDVRPARPARRPARALVPSLFYFAATGGGEGGKYELLLNGAKFADDHGFAAVWTPERHFHAFGGLYPNPSLTSAALATVTRRLRLRAGSVVLPLHHPVRVAEEWSVVDNLSGGRVDVAFASGWHAEDFAFAPADYARRKEIMLERIETVRRLWRGEAVPVASGDGSERSVTLFPKPLQPDLPMWLTAAGTPETFESAARLRANVLTHLLGQDLDGLREKIGLYHHTLAALGLDRDAFTVTLMLHAYVDESADRTRAVALEPFRQYLKSSLDLVARLIRTLKLDLDLDRMSTSDLEDLITFAADRYMRTSGLFGTRASCLEMLDQVAALGVNEVACLIDFGVGNAAAMASLARIAELFEEFNRPAEPADRSVAALLERCGATMIQCTPSLASMLLKGDAARRRVGTMRAVMLGGEPVPPGLVQDLGAPHCLNMYGPTETTVWSGVTRLAPDGERVTIGGAISNTQLYVLDGDARPLPDGLPGEVWIGGLGVARGYGNAPMLTAERFVPDPYGVDPGARLYRTGDLARQAADGAIELLGRADQQVKIRGYRVELGEIEACMQGVPGVRAAVAIKRHDAQRGDEILAWVVPEDAARFDPDTLREQLQSRLPVYMVPAAIAAVDALPLTPNGKVDRRRLAATGTPSRERKARAIVAPQSELETLVRGIWNEVLGVADLSVDDNFFDVGGHSLLIVQVHERLQRTLRRSFPLLMLLERPTIRGIAAYLDHAHTDAPDDVAKRAQDQRRALLARRPQVTTP